MSKDDSRLSDTDGHSWPALLQPLVMACCPQIMLPSFEERQGRPCPLSQGAHSGTWGPARPPGLGSGRLLKTWLLTLLVGVCFAFFTVCSLRWFSKNIGCQVWTNAAEAAPVSHGASSSVCACHCARGLRGVHHSVTAAPCVEVQPFHFRIRKLGFERLVTCLRS